MKLKLKLKLELPWTSVQPNLPSNRSMVEHRLQCLKIRLAKDESLTCFWKGVQERYLKRQWHETGILWQLPHHNVIHSKKPEKEWFLTVQPNLRKIIEQKRISRLWFDERERSKELKNINIHEDFLPVKLALRMKWKGMEHGDWCVSV